MSEGTVVVDMALNDSAYKAGLKDAEKLASDTGKNIEKSLVGIGGSLKGVEVAYAAGLAAIAYAAKKVMDWTLGAATQVETMSTALAAVGKNSVYTQSQLDGYVESLKELSMSSDGASKAIISMIQANINLSHTTDLARIALDGSVVSGQSAEAAMQSLIKAIQFGYRIQFKSLGLNIDLKKAYEDEAIALGTVASKLTPMEQIHARLVAVQKEAAKSTGTFEDSLKTLSGATKQADSTLFELKATIGKVFLPAAKAVVAEYAKSLDSLYASVKQFVDSGGMAKLASTFEMLATAVAKVIPLLANSLISVVGFLYKFGDALKFVGIYLVAARLVPLIMSLASGIVILGDALVAGATAAAIEAGGLNILAAAATRAKIALMGLTATNVIVLTLSLLAMAAYKKWQEATDAAADANEELRKSMLQDDLEANRKTVDLYGDALFKAEDRVKGFEDKLKELFPWFGFISRAVIGLMKVLAALGFDNMYSQLDRAKTEFKTAFNVLDEQYKKSQVKSIEDEGASSKETLQRQEAAAELAILKAKNAEALANTKRTYETEKLLAEEKGQSVQESINKQYDFAIAIAKQERSNAYAEASKEAATKALLERDSFNSSAFWAQKRAEIEAKYRGQEKDAALEQLKQTIEMNKQREQSLLSYYKDIGFLEKEYVDANIAAWERQAIEMERILGASFNRKQWMAVKELELDISIIKQKTALLEQYNDAIGGSTEYLAAIEAQYDAEEKLDIEKFKNMGLAEDAAMMAAMIKAKKLADFRISQIDRVIDANNRMLNLMSAAKGEASPEAEELAKLGADLKWGKTATGMKEDVEADRALDAQQKADAIRKIEILAAQATANEKLDIEDSFNKKRIAQLEQFDKRGAAYRQAQLKGAEIQYRRELELFKNITGGKEKAEKNYQERVGTIKQEAFEQDMAQLSAGFGALQNAFSGIASLYEKGSKDAKNWEAAANAMAIAQKIVAVVSAVAAIANQGLGDPYTAFARIAAMAAAMGALLATIGASVGSSSSSTPPPPTYNYGGSTGPLGAETGTASESVSKSLEIMEETYDMENVALNKIYRELRSLNSNITGLVTSIFRTGSGVTAPANTPQNNTRYLTLGEAGGPSAGLGAVAGSSAFMFDPLTGMLSTVLSGIIGDTLGKMTAKDIGDEVVKSMQAFNLFTGDFGSLLLNAVGGGELGRNIGKTVSWAFGGDVEQERLSTGIATLSTSINNLIAEGGTGTIGARAYSLVKTTVGGGLFHGDDESYQKYYGELDKSVSGMLDKVFKSMGATLTVLAGELGTDVSKTLAYVFEGTELNLQGLSPEKMIEKLTTYFSDMADKAASTLFGDIILQYQNINEALFETAVRLVKDKNIIQSILDLTNTQTEFEATSIRKSRMAISEEWKAWNDAKENLEKARMQWFVDAAKAMFTGGVIPVYPTLSAEPVKMVEEFYDEITTGTQKMIALSESLIEKFGDLDTLVDKFNTYYDAFTTEEEKQKDLQEKLTRVFQAANLVIPANRIEYAKLVTAYGNLLKTTVGAELESVETAWTTLISMGEYADTYYSTLEEAAEDAADAQKDYVDSLKEMITTIDEWLANLNLSELNPGGVSAASYNAEYVRKANTAFAEGATTEQMNDFLNYATDYLNFMKKYTGEDAADYKVIYDSVVQDVNILRDTVSAAITANGGDPVVTAVTEANDTLLTISGTLDSIDEYLRVLSLSPVTAPFVDLVTPVASATASVDLPIFGDGGLTNGLSYAGDKGREWIVPTYEPQRTSFLESVGVNPEVIGKSIARAFMAESSSDSGGKEVHVHLYIDRKEITDSVVAGIRSGDEDLVKNLRKVVN